MHPCQLPTASSSPFLPQCMWAVAQVLPTSASEGLLLPSATYSPFLPENMQADGHLRLPFYHKWRFPGHLPVFSYQALSLVLGIHAGGSTRVATVRAPGIPRVANPFTTPRRAAEKGVRLQAEHGTPSRLEPQAESHVPDRDPGCERGASSACFFPDSSLQKLAALHLP